MEGACSSSEFVGKYARSKQRRKISYYVANVSCPYSEELLATIKMHANK